MVRFCRRQSDQPASAGDRLGVHSPDLRPDPPGGHAVSEGGHTARGVAGCPPALQGPVTLVESCMVCVLGFLRSGGSQKDFLYSLRVLKDEMAVDFSHPSH